MHKRASHRRSIRRSKLLLVAVGSPTVAAMALAFGAAGPASAASGPLAPGVQSATPGPVTPVPLPISVGSVPAVGPLVAPGSVSSTPASSPAPAPGAVKAQASSAQITVTPNSNLTNGQQVQVKGSGFAASSAGGMAECNSTPNQPNDQVYGNNVPVGCTNPLQSLVATDATGSFSYTFTVKTGTIGPPTQGKDSSGGDSAADSAKYPCPPTAAQQAQGITCSITYGDASGNQGSANITFAGGSSSTGSNGPAATGTTAAGAGGGSTGTTAAGGGGSGSASGPTAGATDSAGGTGATAASGGGPLPFTGFGVGMWRLALLGVLLTGLGVSMVVASRRPGAVRRRVARVGSFVVSTVGSWSFLRSAGHARQRRRSPIPRVLTGH